MRESTVRRTTNETQVEVTLRLDGSGRYEVATGIGMLDHLIEQIARHGGFDLTLRARGDLDRDTHHTAEDTGIALGQAFDQALGDRAGITRMADALVPLDEALVQAAVDLSGRPYVSAELPLRGPMIGELPVSMVPHFLRSFAQAGRMTLHLRALAGEDDHHIVEAGFKALARALRAATAIDPRAAGTVPSTKGTLTS